MSFPHLNTKIPHRLTGQLQKTLHAMPSVTPGSLSKFRWLGTSTNCEWECSQSRAYLCFCHTLKNPSPFLQPQPLQIPNNQRNNNNDHNNSSNTHTHTHTQARKHTSTQTRKHTSTQAQKHTSTKAHKHKSTKTQKHKSTKAQETSPPTILLPVRTGLYGTLAG